MKKLITKITYSKQKEQFIDFVSELSNLVYISLGFDECIICEENYEEKKKETIFLMMKKISIIFNIKVFIRYYEFNNLTNYWLFDKGELIAEYNLTSIDILDVKVKKDTAIMYSLEKLSEYLAIPQQLTNLSDSIFCQYSNYSKLDYENVNYINLFEILGHNKITEIFSNKEIFVVTSFNFVPLDFYL